MRVRVRAQWVLTKITRMRFAHLRLALLPQQLSSSTKRIASVLATAGTARHRQRRGRREGQRKESKSKSKSVASGTSTSRAGKHNCSLHHPHSCTVS